MLVKTARIILQLANRINQTTLLAYPTKSLWSCPFLHSAGYKLRITQRTSWPSTSSSCLPLLCQSSMLNTDSIIRRLLLASTSSNLIMYTHEIRLFEGRFQWARYVFPFTWVYVHFGLWGEQLIECLVHFHIFCSNRSGGETRQGNIEIRALYGPHTWTLLVQNL